MTGMRRRGVGPSRRLGRVLKGYHNRYGGVMRTENLQGRQKRYQEAMRTFWDIRKDM
jgi:hypothetical protein